MSTPDPWLLFRAGRRAEAFEIWESRFGTFWEGSARSQRAYAWLALGETERALEDFRLARRCGKRGADPRVGAALWLLGQRDAACQDWSAEIDALHKGEIEFVDLAGGVWIPALLWWASACPDLGNWRRSALKELRQRWRTQRCKRSRWPGTIAGFLLGDRTPEDLLAASASSSVMAQRAQRSAAHFYLAAVALDRGDGEEYQRRLELVLAEDPDPTFWEYYLARAELERLTGRTYPSRLVDSAPPAS